MYEKQQNKGSSKSIPKAIPILMFPTFAPIAVPNIRPKAKMGPLIK